MAAITSYSRNWIYELVWGYNRVGPETLGDSRHQNPGSKSKLDDVCCANLLQALRGPAPDGGLWNGPEAERLRLRAKSLIILAVLIGEPISRQQGWEYREADATKTASSPA